MARTREVHSFHTDTDIHGRPLSPNQREELLKPYLPREPSTRRVSNSKSKNGPLFHHRQRIRPAIRQLIYTLIFNVIHLFFSVYIRVRQAYHAVIDQLLAVLYYHHRTPEFIRRDVKNLSRLPQHLSVILDLPPEGSNKDGLETLLNDACELVAWSASAGVPMLSIYERTGESHSSRRVKLYHFLIQKSQASLNRHCSIFIAAFHTQ